MMLQEMPVKGQCAPKTTEQGCFHRKDVVSLGYHLPKDSAPQAPAAHAQGGPEKGRGVPGRHLHHVGQRGLRLLASVSHHTFLQKHSKCLQDCTVGFSKAGVLSCSGVVDGFREV